MAEKEVDVVVRKDGEVVVASCAGLSILFIHPKQIEKREREREKEEKKKMEERGGSEISRGWMVGYRPRKGASGQDGSGVIS